MQTLKIYYNSLKSFPSLVASILDEEFFKTHISIFDDMKLHSSLLVLTHGQCLSLCHIAKK
jgi:hypothetical protein